MTFFESFLKPKTKEKKPKVDQGFEDLKEYLKNVEIPKNPEKNFKAAFELFIKLCDNANFNSLDEFLKNEYAQFINADHECGEVRLSHPNMNGIPCIKLNLVGNGNYAKNFLKFIKKFKDNGISVEYSYSPNLSQFR